MEIAVFHLREKLAEAHETYEAADAELQPLPADQRRAVLWRIVGEITDLEDAIRILENHLSGFAAISAEIEEPFLPGLGTQ